MTVTQASGARVPRKPEATAQQRQCGNRADTVDSRRARQPATECGSPVDAQKVEGLKAQVRAGTYRANARRVAARMLGVGRRF